MRYSAYAIILLASVLGGIETGWAADTYQIDPVHSTIGFKVRHLGVSYVTGKFDKFDGELTLDGDSLSDIQGNVDVTTIDTADAKRDGHLKSDDFFSAEKFPAMKFQSTKITRTDDAIAVVGNLTIRDVTKVVILQGQSGGFVTMGETRKTGLVLEGEINRQDFGLTFNKLLETGQAMVGNQVKITLELEANHKTSLPDVKKEDQSTTKPAEKGESKK